MENCENYAEIIGEDYIGGIVSQATNSSIIKCVNRGVVIGQQDSTLSIFSYSIMGGICGSMDGGNILDCMNIGRLSINSEGAEEILAGGIIGMFIPSEKEDNGVFNSINRGLLVPGQNIYPDRAGGIIGATRFRANSCAYVKNCLNAEVLTGSADFSGDILCVDTYDPEYTYEFGVSDCYFIENPFGVSSDYQVVVDNFKICEVNSFSKLDSQFSTIQPLIVGAVTSSDLVKLLNAWVDEQNSSGGTYLKWKYTETNPVELELVYEN